MGSKGHAVVCAFPAQGHINPLLHLSSLLVAKGIGVTFVTTHFFCDRLRESARKSRPAKFQATREEGATQDAQQQGESARQQLQRKGFNEEVGRSIRRRHRKEEDEEEGQGREEEEEDSSCEEEASINFVGLPDGLPSNFDRISPSTELSNAVDHLHSGFEDLMHTLMHLTSPVPSLLISDAFVPWACEVASSFHIRRALFWPQSAAVFTIFAHTDILLSNGINPFQDHLDAASTRLIDFLPGVPALPASYLPYRVKPVGGRDRRFLLMRNLAKQFEQCKEATWILANSFNDLEGLCLNVPQNSARVSMKLVGPLIPLPHSEWQLPEPTQIEEGEDILQWLNTRTVSSVLYISLGSVVTWTNTQVVEVGLGLLSMKQVFLWVMRPWEMRVALPEGLLKFGKVVKFAPQLQVLGHPAIGGFMSHCGWNSTLESLSMGVPILAWPHFLDQFTNCWYVVHVWKVGTELRVVRRGGGEEALVGRDDIERAVTVLMQAEDGQLMRSRALKIKNSARDSMFFGSSHRNLDLFVSEIVSDRCAAGRNQ